MSEDDRPSLPEISLGHFSDTHLGYEAYPALAANGMNARGADLLRAFDTVVRDIIASDPALIVHSGDVADRVYPGMRTMYGLSKYFSDLAGSRLDGTRRQFVVIAGNHELPRNLKELCFLELYRGLPGVHVVTQRYEQITFDPERDGCAPELAHVVVHCLPHDTLKDLARDGGFDAVQPVDGKINILLAHGVAGGSDLYVRSLGREFALPTDVLTRAWDYGALGHWHKQGPVPLVAAGAVSGDDEVGRIWYAGSTENNGFGDLRDNGTERGWLSVTVRPGRMPAVQRRNVPIRSMFRLPVVDGTGMNPTEISEALRARIKAAEADGTLAGAVVGQIITGVTRDMWSLVDIAAIRAAAGAALHYDLTPKYVASKRDEAAAAVPGLGDLGAILVERAEAILTPSEREPALAMARELLGSALNEAPTAANETDAKAADDSAEAAPVEAA